LTLNDNEIIEWEEYGNTKNATVRIDYSLQLGGVNVAEWFAEYVGEYGSMGTGWWVSQINYDGPDEASLKSWRRQRLKLISLMCQNPKN
jgi:hypothetical protein